MADIFSSKLVKNRTKLVWQYRSATQLREVTQPSFEKSRASRAKCSAESLRDVTENFKNTQFSWVKNKRSLSSGCPLRKELLKCSRIYFQQKLIRSIKIKSRRVEYYVNFSHTYMRTQSRTLFQTFVEILILSWKTRFGHHRYIQFYEFNIHFNAIIRKSRSGFPIKCLSNFGNFYNTKILVV